MARTYAYALAGGLLATFTVTPALSAIILPSHLEEAETWVMLRLDRLYVPVLHWAVANRNIVMTGAVGLVLLTIALCAAARVEFLPKLEGQSGSAPCCRRPSRPGGQRLRQRDA